MINKDEKVKLNLKAYIIQKSLVKCNRKINHYTKVIAKLSKKTEIKKIEDIINTHLIFKKRYESDLLKLNKKRFNLLIEKPLLSKPKTNTNPHAAPSIECAGEGRESKQQINF